MEHRRRCGTFGILVSAFVALCFGCSSGGDGGGGGSPAVPGVVVGGGAQAQALPGGSSEPTTSVEACVSCHASTGRVPVGDVTNVRDAHAIDTDPAGPQTPSGYRELVATLTAVDVTGPSVVIDFGVVDETGAPVVDLLASDGRFGIVRLDPGVDGDPSEWVGIADTSTERFGSGLFEELGGGAYRYTSAFDPTGRILAGDTLRVAIQISSSDIPTENAWCDFDADLAAPNDCVSGTTVTRDIVQTATCNVCHGPTSDTKLSFHGGGRTDVEYCVVCHNPTGNTDFPLLIHKIHAGEALTQGFRDYSDVRFTKDLDDCATCHAGGGADVDHWKTVPYRVACGSCHDDVNFDTGQNHGAGGVQTSNRYCSGCHPADGARATARLPVATLHLGAARTAEAATYRGPGDGFVIESLEDDASADRVTVVYSVVKSGSRMDLATAPEWTKGGSLSLRAGWRTVDYTNTGSGVVPAQPIRIDARDLGGAVTALGSNRYQAVFTLPDAASGTLSVHLEGRPVADLLGDGSFGDRIPVKSAIAFVGIDGPRAPDVPRREVVDAARCARCHDSGGAGLAFHGTNRVGEMRVCVVCHNPDATDLGQRPSDPATTPDGKREESIDFKRMVHQIHAGADLAEPLVLYGFGGTAHEYARVEFLGNLRNCETCHAPGSYSGEAASATAPTTIHTGADVADPGDDLNISSTASVCSSCHDGSVAKDHMRLYGATFGALEADIR